MRSDIVEAIRDELRIAQEGDRRIAQIRFTHDAFEGSTTAVPLTPERAKALDSRPLHDLEVLVHPADVTAFLSDERVLVTGVDITRIFGIPVVDESPAS